MSLEIWNNIGGSRTEVNVGDKIVLKGGDGRHYIGIVKEDLSADLKWRRHHIKNADLTSNYYRLVKLNEQPVGAE